MLTELLLTVGVDMMCKIKEVN